ncbi:hypothetical protein BGY98DRAFT_939892 [Russula aff. rugulosa BPL654]|nr:hypothetical protein BGY98DRAFT_939892 [Russula aff. rugulosa BPL654]
MKHVTVCAVPSTVDAGVESRRPFLEVASSRIDDTLLDSIDDRPRWPDNAAVELLKVDKSGSSSAHGNGSGTSERNSDEFYLFVDSIAIITKSPIWGRGALARGRPARGKNPPPLPSAFQYLRYRTSDQIRKHSGRHADIAAPCQGVPSFNHPQCLIPLIQPSYARHCQVNCKTHVAVGTLTYIRSFLRCGSSARFITNVADDCSTLSLCLSAAGKRETLLQSIGIITFVLALYPIAFCSGTALHLPPRTTVHASGSALGCQEGKDLATSQSADDAVPVEVSAEFISENDPASGLIATSSGYVMTRTLGRTGGAIYRGDDGNSVQFTSIERSRTHPPALWHPSC